MRTVSHWGRGRPQKFYLTYSEIMLGWQYVTDTLLVYVISTGENAMYYVLNIWASNWKKKFICNTKEDYRAILSLASKTRATQALVEWNSLGEWVENHYYKTPDSSIWHRETTAERRVKYLRMQAEWEYEQEMRMWHNREIA